MKNTLYDNYYQSRFIAHADRQKVWNVICRYLQNKFIAPSSVVLDIGAGYGSFSNAIVAKEKHAVDLFDVSQHLQKDIHFHKGNFIEVHDLKENYFDVVFASNFLEHLTLEEAILAAEKIYGLLKKNGLFIAMQPNFAYSFRHYFDDYTHKSIFTHKGLSQFLASRNFSLVSLQPKFLPFSTETKLPTHPWLVWLYLHFPLKPFGQQMLIVVRK